MRLMNIRKPGTLILLISLLLAGVIFSLTLTQTMKDSLESKQGVVRVNTNIGPLQRLDVKNRLANMELVTASIANIKEELEDADWIKFVSVKRLWRGDLLIEVLPQVPLATYNDDSYINTEGEIFRSPFVEPTRLPHLYGQQEKSAEMMSQYQKLNMALLGNALKLTVLQLNERGVWRFQDQYGVEVTLGKINISERIRRYLQVYTEIGLQDRLSKIARIDTRYSNGVSIAWKDELTDTVNEHELATNY